MPTCEVCNKATPVPLTCEVEKESGNTFILRVCGHCAATLNLEPSNADS